MMKALRQLLKQIDLFAYHPRTVARNWRALSAFMKDKRAFYSQYDADPPGRCRLHLAAVATRA